MMATNTYLPPSPVTPGFLLISAITQTNPMVITIVNSIYNTYIVNQIVHLSVPASYGMVEADQLNGQITAINGLNFTVALNASQFAPFVIPSATKEKPATISPSGSRNLEFNNTTRLEPFQSINGQIGN